MAHVLMQPHDLLELLEVAAEHACEALGAASISVSRIEQSGAVVRTLVNVGDLGPGEERWPDAEFYPISGDARLKSALHELRSWVQSVDDEHGEPREHDLLVRLHKGSSLSVGIVVDGHIWGEFYATRHIGAPIFDADEVAYCEVLVAILASGVSRTVREAELEELAFHDALTGLLNRRALDVEAALVFDGTVDPLRTVSVVVVDMNGLKTINDTEGHACGDQQIRRVADSLSKAFSALEGSVIARVGGDEFTVLVPDHDVDEVVAAANAVCAAHVGQAHSLGVSVGVASVDLVPGHDVRATELFAAADRAQYLAKRSRAATAMLSGGLSG